MFDITGPESNTDDGTCSRFVAGTGNHVDTTTMTASPDSLSQDQGIAEHSNAVVVPLHLAPLEVTISLLHKILL